MTRSHRLVRSLAPVVGAALLIASCGGDDSAGGSVEEWCAFTAEAEQVDVIFDGLGDPGVDIEAGVKTVRTLAERLPKVAPSEIAADAKIVSDSALVFVKALEDAKYNILDADLSFVNDTAQAATNEAANNRLDEFSQRECGRPFGQADTTADTTGDSGSTPGDTPTDTTGSFDPGSGTLREQLVAQFESIGLSNAEATCIADKLDFNDPAIQSGDVAAMLEFFGACGISLDRLGELGQG